MIFEGLSTRLQDVFKKLKDMERLTEAERRFGHEGSPARLWRQTSTSKVVKGFVER